MDNLEEIYRNRLEQAIVKFFHYQKIQRENRKRRYNLHLLDQFPELAQNQGCQVEEKGVFWKVQGKQKNKAIYLFKRGGRVDLAGFSLEGPEFMPITPEEARKRHLGRIKARLKLNLPDAQVLQAYQAALQALKT